jgi:hypothetical protein
MDTRGDKSVTNMMCFPMTSKIEVLPYALGNMGVERASKGVLAQRMAIERP